MTYDQCVTKFHGQFIEIILKSKIKIPLFTDIFLFTRYMVEINAANCQFTQLQSKIPDYLTFENALENDTVTNGNEINSKCNQTSLFLEPDTIGNNTLGLACANDGNFVIPDPWSEWVIKYEVSQIPSDFGFAPTDGSG